MFQFFKKKISDVPRECEKVPSARDRLMFFEQAEYFQRVNCITGVYCEFGCHSAQTFRMALNTLGQLRKRASFTSHFYAFDTFEGMPEPTGVDRQKRWIRGSNKTSLGQFQKLIAPDLHRSTLVKGLYSESLKEFSLPSGELISLAYLDCDYYSSTIQALSFVEKYMFHGTIIGFDDWNCYYYDPCRGQQKHFQSGVRK